MKKVISLVFTLGMMSLSNAQGWDMSLTNSVFQFPQGFLKVKTSHGLIIGHQYDGSYTQNGRMYISAPAGLGNTYITFKNNIHFTSEQVTNQTPVANSLTLYNNGSVGIGMEKTVLPNITHSLTGEGHKLLVDGSILCEKVKVIENVPNSDHVFEDSYRLRALNEVEQFITENKHLPEIPSAKEFKENGYLIGDMDDLLLRKVEELTLYMIDLEKQINQLKADNNELRTKLDSKKNDILK